VYEEVARGLGPRGQMLKDYHEISRQVAEDRRRRPAEKSWTGIHHQIETEGAWHLHQIVDTAISHLKLDADADVATLSAGLKRRVLLARALAL
jgi:ABC transport system ATP-binding/permease protein